MFGNDILFPDYIKREMQRVQFKSKNADYGLGFSVLDFPGDHTIVRHSGGYPGFITQSGLIQKEKTILVVLTNALDGPARTLIWGIGEILAHLDKKKEEFQLKKEETMQDFKEIIGFYAKWGVALFSQIGPRLVGIAPGENNPIEFMQIYKHDEGYRFIAPKDRPFASPGQKIEFIDGPDGEKVFVDSHGGKAKRYTYSY